MNKLHIGFTKTVELPKGGFLFIDDKPPDVPRARIFDPAKHCFNPLKDIDYKRARELSDILYTINPQGENTLTVRNGKRALLKALLPKERGKNYWGKNSNAPRLDRIEGDDEVSGMIDDILASPVLKRVLCNPTNFSFNPNSVILAKLDRTELGEFDALVLGLLLIAHYPGQLVIPDFGFYGRDVHTSLVRGERLIAGVNFLAELPPVLRRGVLLMKDKVPSGATFEDAETLALYARLEPKTNAYNDFIHGAMA